MNKPAKPEADDDRELDPALSDAEVDAWIDRNSEPLKMSLDQARQSLARGEGDARTFAEIIAEGTRRQLTKPSA